MAQLILQEDKMNKLLEIKIAKEKMEITKEFYQELKGRHKHAREIFSKISTMGTTLCQADLRVVQHEIDKCTENIKRIKRISKSNRNLKAFRTLNQSS